MARKLRIRRFVRIDDDAFLMIGRKLNTVPDNGVTLQHYNNGNPDGDPITSVDVRPVRGPNRRGGKAAYVEFAEGSVGGMRSDEVNVFPGVDELEITVTNNDDPPDSETGPPEEPS